MQFSFGFSWIGLIIFALPMLPNLLFILLPPKAEQEPAKEGGKLLGILENAGRVAYIVLIIFLVSKKEITLINPFTVAMLVFLLLYYFLWFQYFAGGRGRALMGKSFLGIPVPMAVFPVLYFILAALWLRNLPALAAAILFGFAHVVNSYQTLR